MDDKAALEKLKSDEAIAEKRYIAAGDDLDFAREALRKAQDEYFANLGWKWERS